MRDVVADLANPIHQLLDLIEHVIEIAGQAVEFVLSRTHRDPLLHVSGNNALTGLVNDFKACQHPPTDEKSPSKPQKYREDHAPAEGGNHAALGRLQFMNVLPNEELETA